MIKFSPFRAGDICASFTPGYVALHRELFKFCPVEALERLFGVDTTFMIDLFHGTIFPVHLQKFRIHTFRKNNLAKRFPPLFGKYCSINNNDMIFYFSGTGNSRWVAAQLADHFSDTLYPIGEYGRDKNPLVPQFDVKPGEKIGFVFPIHSWGMPPIVTQFIADMQLKGYSNQQVYSIMTCGDECGHSDRMFAEAIKAKGLATKHVYSIVMPNSYICLKEFDVDSKEVQVQKMKQVKLDLPKLIAAIENDQPIFFLQKREAVFEDQIGSDLQSVCQTLAHRQTLYLRQQMYFVW
jgi:flavodoxin